MSYWVQEYIPSWDGHYTVYLAEAGLGSFSTLILAYSMFHKQHTQVTYYTWLVSEVSLYKNVWKSPNRILISEFYVLYNDWSHNDFDFWVYVFNLFLCPQNHWKGPLKRNGHDVLGLVNSFGEPRWGHDMDCWWFFLLSVSLDLELYQSEHQLFMYWLSRCIIRLPWYLQKRI